VSSPNFGQDEVLPYCFHLDALFSHSAAIQDRFDMSAPKLAVFAVVGLALGACVASPNSPAPGPMAGPGPREGAGTVVGAGTGALLGAAVAGGGAGNRLAGAALGGVLGGLIGNRIGAALDDEDKQRAYEAQMDALERGQPGAPVSWRNPDSGRYGTIVPGAAYQQADRKCRAFTHTIYIDGQPQTARGTACRNPDGTWTAVG
jgi:surface antigen